MRSRSKVGAVIGASIVVAALAACTDDGPPEPSCNAPDHVTYTCQPTAGSGCRGGPFWQGVQDHPDTVYPAGCFAEMPECSGIRNGQAVMEMCGDLGSGPVWETPE